MLASPLEAKGGRRDPINLDYRTRQFVPGPEKVQLHLPGGSVGPDGTTGRDCRRVRVLRRLAV